MTTKTDILDLTWVNFSEDDRPACDTSRGHCTREAVWRAVYNWEPGDHHILGPVCQHHKEVFDQSRELYGHNRVHCLKHNMFTSCGEFIRWERLKR